MKFVVCEKVVCFRFALKKRFKISEGEKNTLI